MCQCTDACTNRQPGQGGALRYSRQAHWSHHGGSDPGEARGKVVGAEREEARGGPWARNEAALRAGAKQLGGGFNYTEAGGGRGSEGIGNVAEMAGRGNVADVAEMAQAHHHSVRFQQEPLQLGSQDGPVHDHSRISHQRKRHDVDTAFVHSWRAVTPVCKYPRLK